MNELTPVQLSWLSGVFEGEGSVSVSRQHKGKWIGYYLEMTVTNNDLKMLQPFVQAFGGHISVKKRNPPRKQGYQWNAASRIAEKTLQALLPYLQSEKLRRVELALQFQAQKKSSGGKSNPEYNARQHLFYEKMKILNRRGI